MGSVCQSSGWPGYQPLLCRCTGRSRTSLVRNGRLFVRTEPRRSGGCYLLLGEQDERRSRSQPRFDPMGQSRGRADGEILAGVVGEARVFVWRKGNRLKAYNADCPHLGGPLNEGVVAGPTIRCPWHHACFDLTTGEATAAPAFDALHEYAVTLDDDRFCVKSAHARTPRCAGRQEASRGTMAIIGGGAAGLRSGYAIRKLGWRGGLTIFSEEREQPYDRTLLTKDYLEGSLGTTGCQSPGIPWPTLASTSRLARVSKKSSPGTNVCVWRTGTSDPMRSFFSPQALRHDDWAF